jgi:hypothetical protein
MNPDARKWKRHFMNAERNRRKQKRRLEADLFEVSLKNIRSNRELKELREQIARDQRMIKGQHKVIQHLKKLLQDNSIPEPACTQVASFKTCRAGDNEICPLSLQPINASAPPYNVNYPSIDIEPLKPHHKCAELMCGHRFNGLWLLFHFVARSTFRCPICRSGHEDFKFQMEQLPNGLVDRVRELMGKKG